MSMYRFLECRVQQHMTRDVVTIAPSATLRELDALFAARDFNAVPVVEKDHLVGIVTKFDFLKAFAFTVQQMVPHYDELMSTHVAKVMTTAIVSVETDAPLTRVLQRMVDLRARSFPVVDPDGRLAGIISREDIMRALTRSAEATE